MVENKTYSAKVRCLNCDWRGLMDLPKGEAVIKKDTGIKSLFTDVYFYYRLCPNCNVKQLVPNTGQDNYFLGK